MTIAHQDTQFITPKLVVISSPGWIIGCAVFATVAIAASIYLALFGQGLAQLDPSQIIGP